MSDREIAHSIIDDMDEDQLRGFIMLFRHHTFEIPNEETILSMKELDEGGGYLFSGSTDELFDELGKEE